jgi:hypothetical protein
VELFERIRQDRRIEGISIPRVGAASGASAHGASGVGGCGATAAADAAASVAGVGFVSGGDPGARCDIARGTNALSRSADRGFPPRESTPRILMTVWP